VLTQLRALGYVTLDAGNAAEALAIVRAGHGFDLLFTDVIMPGTMNRPPARRRHRRQRPDLKVLSHLGLHGKCHHSSTAGSTPASCCLPSPTANRISQDDPKAIDG